VSIRAFSTITDGRKSFETAKEVATQLLRELGGAPAVVITYLTVNHDQPAFLEGLASVLGGDVPVVGCSGQGVMGRQVVREEGYAAGVMALAGDSLAAATAFVEDIAEDTFEKGRELGRRLRQSLAQPPKAVVLHYDPMTGVDMAVFLRGLYEEVDCPVVGGAASHFFGPPMTTTFQYFGERVMNHGAVALALAGDFTAEIASCNGCSPVGIEMQVTSAEGNRLLELDGRPALDVWRELSGSVASATSAGNSAAVAIGIIVEGAATESDQLIRAAVFMDPERQGVVLQAAIPTGTRVMLHHRTVPDVLEGAERLGRHLRQRLEGKTLRAVLGFECGARTKPFLGDEATRRENIELQRLVGEDAAWIGVMCWGEVFPVAGKPTFHNYTYPVLAIAE
jgi:hypothetical protein